MIIFQIIFVALILIGPVITVVNFIHVFNLKTDKTPMDIITFVIGFILSAILYSFVFEGNTYDQSIVTGELHEPIFDESIPSLFLFSLVSFISYFCLKIAVAERKVIFPPLVMVLLISGVYLGIAISLFVLIQFLSNVGNEVWLPLLCLLPINYILYAVALILMVSRIKTEEYKGKKYKSSFLNKCNELLANSWKWRGFAIMMFFPVLGVLVMVLTLFGQEPDSMIKAFTYTSDWIFSTKESPPPHEYSGHYLCTVAAGGHVKLVKPIRYGVRGGRRIIVNRQLCVANAFEQIIEERLPRFHFVIRKIYDRYGLPLSNYIRTPLSADFVYIIMKPLEYIFLIVLYLFDSFPEKRIASQYLPK